MLAESEPRSLTIVMGYRDRDLDRVERCLRSLGRQTRTEFKAILVDYGSSVQNSINIRSLVEQFKFCDYAHSDTRGWPWNRSKALNIGIRLAETDFVLATDVDMMFNHDFIETIMEYQDGHSLIHCAPYWLPEGFSDWNYIDNYRSSFQKGDRAQRGGCQCAPRRFLLKTNGYDEALEYWGAEDDDLYQRLMKVGLREIWVDDQTAMYHQWHPVDRGHTPHKYRDLKITPYLENVDDLIVRNDANWGGIIGQGDRVMFDVLPKFKEGVILEWPDMVELLSNDQNLSSVRWYLTDSSNLLAASKSVESSFSLGAIKISWLKSLLLGPKYMENEVGQRIRAALDLLKSESGMQPSVIALDISSYIRLSRPSFLALLDGLTSRGILIINNLGQPRLPRVLTVLGYFFKNLNYLQRVLNWAFPGKKDSMDDLFFHLAGMTRLNHLRDSVYLARVDVDGILDYALHNPAMEDYCIFVKA